MFCPKCGIENKDGAKFCKNCGEDLEKSLQKGKLVDMNEKQKNKMSTPVKKKKKIWLIGLGVLVVLGSIVIGLKLQSHKKNIPTDEEIQVATNNLQNGGLVASDGTWLYYCDVDLYKMYLEDGSKKEVISEALNVEHMSYAGGSLYYYTFPSIYRAKDGEISNDDLGFSVFTENCFQTDGNEYFVTGQGNYEKMGIYAVAVDDTKKSTLISEIDPSFLYLHGDYLYVISNVTYIDNEPNENFGVWRMDKDGNNLISLLDFCPRYMVISGDDIYYSNKENIICSMNLDGSDKKVYDGAIISCGLNVSDKYVFYIDSETSSIIRMDKDGSNKTTLNDNRSENLNIIGDWIFYRNADDGYEIYRMNFEGSYNYPVTEEVTDVVKTDEKTDESVVEQQEKVSEKERLYSWTTAVHYDGDGKITETDKMTENNNIVEKICDDYKYQYEFDQQGNMVREECYRLEEADSSYTLFNKTIYSHNEEGQVISFEDYVYSSSDCTIIRYDYIYTQDGKLVKVEGYNESDEVIFTNNITWKSETEYSFETSQGYTGIFSFDESGVILERICEDKTGYIEKTLFEYDEQGKIKEETHYDLAEDKLIDRIVYNY